MNLKEKVEKALESVKMCLRADGGDIELIDVNEDDGIIKVKLIGACGSCPMANMTLQHKVIDVIKQTVPEVKEVKAV
jgi:Fe-S cluster biogenesis protein NfuA